MASNLEQSFRDLCAEHDLTCIGIAVFPAHEQAFTAYFHVENRLCASGTAETLAEALGRAAMEMRVKRGDVPPVHLAMAQKLLSEFGREELAEYFEYLDDLRESGETNMFGAGSYLREDHGLDRRDAGAVPTAWMHTFDATASASERVEKALAA